MQLKALVDDIEGFSDVVADWSKLIDDGAIVALRGELGAGKTTFVKELAAHKKYASKSEVCSPTFTLLHVYGSSEQKLHHFDLYRLQGSGEFISLGFDEYLYGRGLVCIEWPERIAGLLTMAHYDLEIYHRPEGSGRELILTHRPAV